MITMAQTFSASVTSMDGTVIAYERTGQGRALILIDAAGHYREFTSFAGLIGLLAPRFTVYHYDRRGRGGSTDTQPYAVEREVEDLAALIDEAGGSAFLYAFSSGGLLALHARSGRPANRTHGPARAADRAGRGPLGAARLHHRLANLVAAGRPEDAVEFYLTGIGVPDEIVEDMRGIDLLVGDGVGRADPGLRQPDQRGNLVRPTGFGDGADPRSRQRGQQRRPHRHGRHGGRRATQRHPPQPGR